MNNYHRTPALLLCVCGAGARRRGTCQSPSRPPPRDHDGRRSRGDHRHGAEARPELAGRRHRHLRGFRCRARRARRRLGAATSPRRMPAVVLTQPNGPASFSLSIRGVTQNDFADHQESPAAIYVDDVYVSQMSGLAFSLYDMDRVEVLRGPQGTLFGRNATGGLANFVTRRPTDDTGGYVNVTFGEYNLTRVEGAVNGAVTDGVDARFSFRQQPLRSAVQEHRGRRARFRERQRLVGARPAAVQEPRRWPAAAQCARQPRGRARRRLGAVRHRLREQWRELCSSARKTTLLGHLPGLQCQRHPKRGQIHDHGQPRRLRQDQHQGLYGEVHLRLQRHDVHRHRRLLDPEQELPGRFGRLAVHDLPVLQRERRQPEFARAPAQWRRRRSSTGPPACTACTSMASTTTAGRVPRSSEPRNSTTRAIPLQDYAAYVYAYSGTLALQLRCPIRRGSWIRPGIRSAALCPIRTAACRRPKHRTA